MYEHCTCDGEIQAIASPWAVLSVIIVPASGTTVTRLRSADNVPVGHACIVKADNVMLWPIVSVSIILTDT